MRYLVTARSGRERTRRWRGRSTTARSAADRSPATNTFATWRSAQPAWTTGACSGSKSATARRRSPEERDSTWEAVFHPRQGPGRACAQPLPRSDRHRAVGVRRLRLLGAPRSAARNQGPPVPSAGTVGLYFRRGVFLLQALLVAPGLSLGAWPRARSGADATRPALRSSSLTRDEELTVRSMQAEAALLQDDLDQAASLARPSPDTFRDTVPAAPRRHAVAPARPAGVGARRSVARHRHARRAR